MICVSRSAKKKVHKKREYTRGDYARVTISILIIGGFLYTLTAQQFRLVDIRKETARCREEIALQEKEYEKLKEKAAYSSSDRFYEEKARDEGYVREDETVFIIGN